MKYDEKNFNYCLNHTTIENKLMCTAEECAELTQCCTKMLRKRWDGREHMIEEMSDVMVNIYLLASHLNIDMEEIREVGDVKLARFKSRLEAGENP